jgi:hypothetical protein
MKGQSMTVPEGERFSLVYLKRGEPLRDSVRLRTRLSTQFYELTTESERNAFLTLVKKELGTGQRLVRNHFENSELRDLLDLPTLAYRLLNGSDRQRWHAFVVRCFAEEGMGYRVDARCGIHFFVDQEFEATRVAGLAALDLPTLAAARHAYDEAFRFLDGESPNTKGAVRGIFECVEILVKQACPGVPRLATFVIKDELKPRLISRAGASAAEHKATESLCAALADWAEAAHLYRHGQAEPEPSAPSLALTIQFLSMGSAYARWIAVVLLNPVTDGTAPAAPPPAA